MTMLKRISRGLLAACLAAGAASCTGSDTPTSPVVFVGPPNLVVTDVRVGTGAVLAVGQTATVHYGLWLYDPSGNDSKGVFLQDSRLTASAITGFKIKIAAGEVIQGWVDGLPGMRVGGLRRLIIPPSLAYGSTGNGQIPPNAWLVFDVDLLGVDD
jgi:FKBP-type peptidyl-prolyl cis-trans isomerase